MTYSYTTLWDVTQACQNPPDVILLDVIMPIVDGLEVLGKLRDNPCTKGIPVVLLTALSPVKGERAALDYGVTHYISKPWPRGTVELAVRVALREVSGRAAEDGDRTIRTGIVSPEGSWVVASLGDR